VSEPSAWHFTVLGYPVGLGAPQWLLLGVLALAVGAVAAFEIGRASCRERVLRLV